MIDPLAGLRRGDDKRARRLIRILTIITLVAALVVLALMFRSYRECRAEGFTRGTCFILIG